MSTMSKYHGTIALATWAGLLFGFATAADKEIIPKNAKLEKVAGGCKFTEGPAADADGNLFFTDSPNHRIMVLRNDGKLEVWDKASQDANGMRFDAKGRLLACCGEDGARAVVRYEKDGKKTVLADRYNGKRLTAPNDLCIDRQGRVWFTDPCYGRRPKDGQEKYAVYRIDAEAGEPVVNKLTRIIDDVDTPNGIALSPDQKTLYVADNAAQGRPAHPGRLRHRGGRQLQASGGLTRLQGPARHRRHGGGHRRQHLCDGREWRGRASTSSRRTASGSASFALPRRRRTAPSATRT